MMRAIFWKEWHENRSKYLFYWFTINAPVLLLALAIGLTSGARVPFADLSDALTMKYLPLALVETLFVTTIFLLLTGYLAVATFGPEIDDHSLFFIYEQPISRKTYLGVKLLYGALHVVLATCCAILLLPVAAYVMMLLSGKVTVAGSGSTFAMVMAAAARCVLWGSLISLAAFTASAVVSAVVPRWWLAAICSVAFTACAIYTAGDFFDYFPDAIPDNSMSVGFSLSTGNSQWITISRALKPEELIGFGRLKPWPLLTAALLIAAFSTAATLLYNRKELK
jgi:hypothetical protein